MEFQIVRNIHPLSAPLLLLLGGALLPPPSRAVLNYNIF